MSTQQTALSTAHISIHTQFLTLEFFCGPGTAWRKQWDFHFQIYVLHISYRQVEADFFDKPCQPERNQTCYAYWAFRVLETKFKKTDDITVNNNNKTKTTTTTMVIIILLMYS